MVHNCESCGNSYPNLKHHVCSQAGQRGGHVGPTPHDVDQSFFKETRRSHRGVVIDYTYTVEPDKVYNNIYDFFDHIHEPLARLLQDHMKFWHGITVQYRQLTELEDKITSDKDTKYLSTNSITLRHENFIDSTIHFIFNWRLTQLEIYNSNGSGYYISRIENAVVSIGQYKSIRERGYIPTPPEMKGRHGLLNIFLRQMECVLNIALQQISTKIKLKR